LCEAPLPFFPHARSVSSNQPPAPCKPADPQVSVTNRKNAATPFSPYSSSWRCPSLPGARQCQRNPHRRPRLLRGCPRRPKSQRRETARQARTRRWCCRHSKS
jgi:hypothetical protein